MIKVELFYKVSMFGSDWMVSADEFEEMRKDFLEIPDYVPLQRKKGYSFPEKIKGSWGESEEKEEVEEELEIDQVETPDFKEIPLENIRPDYEASSEEFQESKPEKSKEPDDPYQKYVDMILSGHQKTAITRAMINDLGVATTTAANYYYQKVKPRADAFIGLNEEASEKRKKAMADREFEKQKKDLLRNLETKTNTNDKIQVIPPYEPGVPEPGKLFSKEFREMIQEKSKGSSFFKGSK